MPERTFKSICTELMGVWRGRIEEALARIKQGTYGVCEV